MLSCVGLNKKTKALINIFKHLIFYSCNWFCFLKIISTLEPDIDSCIFTEWRNGKSIFPFC